MNYLVEIKEYYLLTTATKDTIIMKREVEYATKQLKNNGSFGSGNVYPKIMTLTNDSNIDLFE